MIFSEFQDKKLSLLGFGAMRLPMKDGQIDQELVEKMVRYGIDHGVNYFDTAPVYCQTKSEEATGIALSRYPRNSYYLATKMSNFSNWTFENSKLMYERSMRLLQTDYFDYYLLHNISSIEMFNARFIDNGILDFLMKEREAGRIRNLGCHSMACRRSSTTYSHITTRYIGTSCRFR